MSTDRTLRELMSLDGRVALVTGGAGHIGRAIGHALAELGANVAVVDLSQSGAEAAASELGQRWPVTATGFACDLEQSDEVRDLPRRVRERFGRIDIIVNCAAFVGTSGLEGWAVPFEQQSDKTWRRALEVNLTAPVRPGSGRRGRSEGFRAWQRHQYFLDLRALRARLAAL